jgi:hypothetical protein
MLRRHAEETEIPSRVVLAVIGVHPCSERKELYMSYNISMLRYMENSDKLSISKEIFEALKNHEINEYMEANFITEECVTSANEDYIIDEFYWEGQFTGSWFDVLEKDIIAHMKGEATLLCVWEDGDTVEIWHIKDGVLVQDEIK